MQVTAPPSSDVVVDAVLSASRALVAVAARSLAEVGDEVTLTQYRTLVVLCARGPQNLAALAEAVGVTPATATRMCDRLLKKHLISRHVDRHDRRHVRLGPTKDARALVARVSDARRREIAIIVDAIAPAQRALVVDALHRFADAAGEVPEQNWSTGWEL